MLEPFGWNVVVLGRWNRAILTPQGVVTRLFQKPEGTEFDVEVPMDALGPYRVHFDNLIVIVATGQLIVETEANNDAALRKARELACRALDDLPETPVSAAGFNLRFRSTEESIVGKVSNAVSCQLDNRFVESGYSVESHDTTTTVASPPGKIQTKIVRASGLVEIHINFERQGTKYAQLQEWLRMPDDQIEKHISQIQAKVIGL